MGVVVKVEAKKFFEMEAEAVKTFGASTSLMMILTAKMTWVDDIIDLNDFDVLK